MVEIKEVKTKKERKIFATFPVKHYEKCPYYVPSFYSDEISILDEKKNFSLETCDVKCFLAYKDGKVVGRIAGIIQNQHNEIQNVKNIRFSRFECIDDKEVSTALFDAVANFGREHGMTKMHGPWGFNDQDREGMLTYGFDRRSTFVTNYSYDYYPAHVYDYGFDDECEWVEYELHCTEKVDDRFNRLAERIKKRNGFVELADTMPINQIVKRYGKEVFGVINECYKVLDGYVPVEGKVLDGILDSFGIICNPDYLSIIANKEGKIVAFGLAFPSICDAVIKGKGKMTLPTIFRLLKAIKKPTEIELALIAVLPEYRTMGLNALVINRIQQNLVKNGIKVVESNPELVTNLAVQGQWENVDREIIKRRKCFIKSI